MCHQKIVAMFVVFCFVGCAAQTKVTQGGYQATRVISYEEIARQDLERAKALRQIGEIKASETVLQRVIANFPNTQVARNAASLLQQWQSTISSPKTVQQEQQPILDAPTPAILPEIDEAKIVRQASVGVILPLSGSFSPYGERTLTSLQLALGFRAAHQKGQKIEVQKSGALTLVIGDSQGNPVVAKDLVQEMAKQHKVLMIVGDILLETSKDVAEAATKVQVPVVVLSRREDVTKISDWVFRVGITTKKQVTSLIEGALSQGIKRFAVLYPKNTFGIDMMTQFKQVAAKNGAVLSFVEAYEPEQTTFTLMAKKLKHNSEHFDALFLPDFPKTLSYLIPALVSEDFLFSKNPNVVAALIRTKEQEHPKKTQLLGPNSWNSSLLEERLGTQIDGAWFVDGVSLQETDERTVKFNEQFQEVYHSSPTIVEAQAYNAGMMITQFLQGKEPPKTREDVKNKLPQFAWVGLDGPISFGADRDSVSQLLWFTFEGGKIVPLVSN